MIFFEFHLYLDFWGLKILCLLSFFPVTMITMRHFLIPSSQEWLPFFLGNEKTFLYSARLNVTSLGSFGNPDVCFSPTTPYLWLITNTLLSISWLSAPRLTPLYVILSNYLTSRREKKVIYAKLIIQHTIVGSSLFLSPFCFNFPFNQKFLFLYFSSIR